MSKTPTPKRAQTRHKSGRLRTIKGASRDARTIKGVSPTSGRVWAKTEGQTAFHSIVKVVRADTRKVAKAVKSAAWTIHAQDRRKKG